jgi:hypothetical protein
MADIDPLSTRFRAKQAAYFRNLAHVPFASWTYSVDGTNAAPSDGSQFLHYEAPVWLPHLSLHYAIAGFDLRPTSSDLYYTFVQRSGRWYIGSDSDDGDLAYDSARDLWDFGPVTVIRGRSAIVLGHPGGRVSLTGLAAEADRDVPRVTRVWGRSWSRRVVILAPNSQRELSSLIGGGGDLSQIAAVAAAELVGDQAKAAPVGDRVIVNPINYQKLSALGREIVITHEITHVASRAATGSLEPTWLIEGLADYVGYRETALPPRIAAHDLRMRLATGHRLGGLPTDADYGGSNTLLSVAYDKSWLACRFMAERFGQSALLRVYRAVGATAHGSESTATDAAMRAVLHISLTTFTSQWQRYVVAVLR